MEPSPVCVSPSDQAQPLHAGECSLLASQADDPKGDEDMTHLCAERGVHGTTQGDHAACTSTLGSVGRIGPIPLRVPSGARQLYSTSPPPRTAS